MKFRTLLLASMVLALIGGNTYAKKDKDHGHPHSLPPGLQKNQERGKPLPPGWQKNLSKGDILDRDIYAKGRVVVPLGKDGSVSIEVDGTIIKMHEKTREIIDILKL